MSRRMYYQLTQGEPACQDECTTGSRKASQCVKTNVLPAHARRASVSRRMYYRLTQGEPVCAKCAKSRMQAYSRQASSIDLSRIDDCLGAGLLWLQVGLELSNEARGLPLLDRA